MATGSSSSSSTSLVNDGITLNSSKMPRYQMKPDPPSGFFPLMWARIEVVCVYLSVLVQTLLLIAGLTVLHFSTFSVMMVYFIEGFIRKRRELLPQDRMPSAWLQ